jgi:hypothetical protein
MPYYIYRLVGYTNSDIRNHYIGSTPNPYKRIRQHNGIICGGAKNTSSRLYKLINNNETNLKWNYDWILMTFLNKKDALSLEWHMKHPFSCIEINDNIKNHYAKVIFNGKFYNKRCNKLYYDINLMLKQIDITIEYVFVKNNILLNDRTIFLLLDSENMRLINYCPINFKIHYIDKFKYSIINNNLFNYLNKCI